MPKRSSTPWPAKPAGKPVRADGRVMQVRYTRAVAGEICRRLSSGEVWYRICNTGRLPSYDTLYRWMRRHPEFAEDVAQAREMAADLRADKALVVAEESTAATVQSDRLHVSALQWRAAKAAPHIYGPKGFDGEREPARLIVEVRRFERAFREDGTPYVVELLPKPTGRGR